jgi:S-formylglutathione hydrolase FrmB
MGGHGALLMAINHSDVFGAAGSMSGGVDLTFKPKSWQIALRLGNYETNKEVWLKNSVFHQIQKLQGKNVALIIDCGKDDFFYEINKKLHNKMLELKIPHDFIVRPGEHSWDYWKSSIEFQMLFFYKFFYPQN